jgi:hypothetical protein
MFKFPAFFQECQKSVKQKSELVNRLEEKSSAFADTLRKLDDKYVRTEPKF